MLIICFIISRISWLRIECLGMMETSGDGSHLENFSALSWTWLRHFKGFDLIKFSTIESPTGPLKWFGFLIKLRGGGLPGEFWSVEKASITWYAVRNCSTSFDGASQMTKCHFHCIKSLTGLSLNPAQLQTEVAKHGHEVVKNPLYLSGWQSGWNSMLWPEFIHIEKDLLLSSTSV